MPGLVGPALEPSLSVNCELWDGGRRHGERSLGTGPREFPWHRGAWKHHTLIFSPGHLLAIGGASIHLRTILPGTE